MQNDFLNKKETNAVYCRGSSGKMIKLTQSKNILSGHLRSGDGISDRHNQISHSLSSTHKASNVRTGAGMSATIGDSDEGEQNDLSCSDKGDAFFSSPWKHLEAQSNKVMQFPCYTRPKSISSNRSRSSFRSNMGFNVKDLPNNSSLLVVTSSKVDQYTSGNRTVATMRENNQDFPHQQNPHVRLFPPTKLSFSQLVEEKGVRAGLEKIFANQLLILSKMKSLDEKVEKLNENSEATVTVPAGWPSALPLSSLVGLKKFNAFLEESSENYAFAVRRFTFRGGKDAESMCRKCLRYLISEALRSQLNWKGSALKTGMINSMAINAIFG